MLSLNPEKTFNKNNHPFMLGLKGASYQTFAEWSGRKGYPLNESFKKIDGVFTVTYIEGKLSYTDGLSHRSLKPTTAAEKLAYFSGRIINSLVSIPFHLVRTIVDLSLQILQTTAFVFELGSTKLAGKISKSYNPSFTVSRAIATIRNFSGCYNAINQLAERLFLIDKYTEIKSFSGVVRHALTA